MTWEPVEGCNPDGATDTRPPYLRIADGLRAQIVGRVLALGAMIPPYVALARQHGVSITTAKKAVDLLVEQGFLGRVRGLGSKVISQTPKSAEGRALRAMRDVHAYLSNGEQVITDLQAAVKRIRPSRRRAE